MKQTTDAICLHRSNYSESSVLVSCLTRDSGIQKYIFKGGKKRSAQLFALAPLELTFSGHPHAELKNLYQATLLFNPTFPNDPYRVSVAFFICGVVSKIMGAGQQDEQLYQLLQRTIKQLDQDESIRYLPLQFLCGLIEVLGISPLDEGKDPIFNLKEGIIGRSRDDKYTIATPAVDLIRSLLSGDTPTHSEKHLRSEALDILLSYLGYHYPVLKQADAVRIIRETLE